MKENWKIRQNRISHRQMPDWRRKVKLVELQKDEVIIWKKDSDFAGKIDIRKIRETNGCAENG